MPYQMSETEVQSSILEWLHFKNIKAWRNNSHAVFDAANNCHRRKSVHDINGVSDILGILPCGKFLAIEVKKNIKCKATKDQRKFIDEIKSNGGIAFVAWSLEIVSKKLHKYI